MRAGLAALLLSGTGWAGGAVEGTLTVKRDGQPAFAKNTLIYIRGYKTDAPSAPLELAQQGRAFDKVVLPVVKQGKVRFTNAELDGTLYHHVFTPGPRTKFASGKLKPSDRPFVTPPLTDEGPVTVFCDIHKEMISTVYVVPNDRYLLLATAEGNSAPFKLDGIQPGRWTIVAWHRSVARPLEVPVEIKEGQTTRLDLTLDGESGVENALLNHKRRELGAYAPKKPDGGSVGEAIGLEDKWK